jgi:hypothetical protein
MVPLAGRLLILSTTWEDHDKEKMIICTGKHAAITDYPVNSVVPFGEKQVPNLPYICQSTNR